MNTAIGTLSTEALLRMWNTRPVRSGSDGTVGGVCSGIARRYQVDPTLVKVAFVVATLFGGSGVILYILAWITLPADDEAPSTRAGRRERQAKNRTARDEHRQNRRSRGHHHGSRRGPHSHPPTIVLIVILVIVLTSLAPNIAWGSGGVLGAALMLLGWWLLYQRRPDAQPGTSADTIGTAPIVATETFTRWMPRAWADNVAAATTPTTLATPTTPYTATPQGVDLVKDDTPTLPGLSSPPTPPAWDPLGAAPFAWDLPEPSTPTPPPSVRRRRSALTPVTLGIAVLAVAAATTAAFAGVGAITPTRITAIGLAIVSAGLIAGAMARKGSGLAPVAVTLAIVVVFTAAASHLGSIPGGGAGDRNWRPLTENDIAAGYELTVGSGTLDLRSVKLTGDRSVRIRVGLGEAKIVAPAGMNLKTQCRTTIGEEQCRSGIDGGTDGTSGPVLDITASSIVGHVEVTRG